MGDDHEHDDTASTFWAERYGDAPIWSGRVNRSMADAATRLTPGTALDLGSGEGGDAVWLATEGWAVTAVDIAGSALDRGRDAATAAGVGDRIDWVLADLATWTTEQRFDLVTASFLHSPVAFPRTAVLRRAAAAVAPGGHLLVVGHAAFPPWSGHAHHDDEGSRLLGPDEQVDDLALDPEAWTVLLAELRPREATGPDGQSATIDDTVVLARRGA